jgi:hypothetical protein
MAALEQPRASLARPRTLINWTRFVVKHRRPVLATRIILLLLGGWATSDLGRLLTNRFSVPGSAVRRVG